MRHRIALNLFLQLVCCGLLIVKSAALAPNQSEGPDTGLRRLEILADGRKALNYWFSHSNKPSCGWEDGTLMFGVATLQKATSDQALLNYTLQYGENFQWQMCLKLGGAAWNPDNQVCAATYAELYLNNDNSSRSVDWIEPSIDHLNAEIASHDTTVKNWSWLDALFMAMSVYSRIGAATGDHKYFDKMFANFNYSVLTQYPNGYGFWSPNERLFYRDPPRGSPNGIFWARGNGWAVAALVQAISLSPPGDPYVPVYTHIYKQHVARLAELQGADGCWRCSLTNPAYNPVPETTGTAMFAYAMSYGIKAGLLDPATYLPVVEKAWSCLTTVSLHPDGKLGNCQPGGSAPQRNFGPETTNSFCVGQFAMAAAGVAQLAQ